MSPGGWSGFGGRFRFRRIRYRRGCVNDETDVILIIYCGGYFSRCLLTVLIRLCASLGGARSG